MKAAGNMEKLIKKFCLKQKSCVTTSTEMDKRILDDALAALEKSKEGKSAATEPNIWRTIMKSPITKLATAAAIIFIVVLGITLLDKSTAPAWAIEQTVEALENVQTLIISGTDGAESMPFKCWFKFTDESSDSFDMRYECEKKIVVVRGIRTIEYWPDENVAKVYKNVKTSDGLLIRELRIWYKIAQLSPWITGKILATLKPFTDDWQQIYGKDERTEQDCVFVTCSYKPLSMSFWFICDLKSKLIVEGKYWRNADREGSPQCHAASFAYNEEISDEVFNFQIPEGTKVINIEEQEKADALFNRGEKLFEEKETFQAIEVFQEVYEKYRNLNIAESSLMMIGICYERMGQVEKAIKTYEKAIEEYPDLKGWISATYFYLGHAYMKIGQKDKALEAFRNCLVMGDGIRGSDKFPLKHAREYIEKLESKE